MSARMIRRRLEGGTLAAVRRMRAKVILVALVAVTVVLAGVITGINLLNWKDTCHRIDDVMAYVEETDGDLGQLDYDYDAHPDLSGRAYEALLEMPYDARYFTVTLDEDGNVIDSNMNSIVSVSDDTAAQMAQDVYESDDYQGFEGSYRYRKVAIEGGIKVYFLYSYSELEAFRAFRDASVTMGLLGLLAFVAVVLPFARVSTRPVEEAQARQRRFVTDASHELRTPITIIQSAADVIELEDGETEWTESIHHQTKRLEDLTNKLVALAKADEGGKSLVLADVDLSEMALQVAEDFEPVSQAQGKPLATDIEEGAHVRADAGMLEQVLSILLDNAFKHSPDGAHVRFSVSTGDRGMGARRSRAGVRIAVTNDAPDVAAGRHPEFFGRFYKADASRAYEKGSGGHGIGLAVVRAVAEAHGGSVEAMSDGHDVTIAMTL